MVTNHDNIKNMSLREMAYLLRFNEPYCGTANKECDGDCFECAITWLEQEVEQ